LVTLTRDSAKAIRTKYINVLRIIILLKKFKIPVL
jgi:hypothetical protein